MLSVQKKIEDNTQYEQFVKQIEDASQESKMQLSDLRDIFDNNGIFIRDALYDQLASYFDLDRNDKIYITSFCEYLINPRLTNFNFFKVHPIIVVNLVAEYIRNEVQLKEDTMSLFEAELRSNIKAQRQLGMPEGVEATLPEDVLVQEKITATQFHQLMKKYGVQLTLWEIFTLFDHLNTTYQKQYYEPHRYHHITFPPFYRFLTNEDYEAKLRQDAIRRDALQREQDLKRHFEEEQERLMKEQQEKLLRASMDSAMNFAADLNNRRNKKKKRRHQDPEDDGGVFSDSKNVEEEEVDEEVVIKKKKRVKHKSPLITESYDSEDDEDEEDAKDQRPFRKMKHTFEI